MLNTSQLVSFLADGLRCMFYQEIIFCDDQNKDPGLPNEEEYIEQEEIKPTLKQKQFKEIFMSFIVCMTRR